MTFKFTGWLSEFSSALWRFPEASFLALCCTLWSISVQFGGIFETGGSEQFSRIYFGLFVGFFAALAIGIYAERKAVPVTLRLGLIGAAAAVIAALVAFPHIFDASYVLLACFVALLPALAAHTELAADNDSYWIYNHDLWLGAAMAAVAAILVALGIMAILGTIDTLFQVRIGSGLYSVIWQLAWNLVAPLTWLALVPRVDQPQPAIDLNATTTRAIGLLSKFILVPLLLVYALIIFAYAAKISVTGVVPKGQIGWMVLIFAAIGTTTVLMVYPLREQSGALPRFFFNNWFLITLIPVLLLFWAVYERTEEYGVTDVRYIVILLGIWIALLAVPFGLKHAERRDLRIVPLSLVALLALASFGPWGAIGLTVRQQVSNFSDSLAALATLPHADAEAAKKRMSSSAQYLAERGHLGDLLPFYENKPGAKTLDVSPHFRGSAQVAQLDAFLKMAELPKIDSGRYGVPDRHHVDYNANSAAAVVGMKGFGGPLNFWLGQPAEAVGRDVVLNGKTVIRAALEGDTLVVTHEDGRKISFDGQLIRDRLKTVSQGISGDEQRKPPLKIEGNTSGFAVELYIYGANGYNDTDTKTGALMALNFWLAWKD